MIVLAALMIARTCAGAPFGIAARPLRRIIAVLPATVGVFEMGKAGIDDHGSLFQSVGASCGSPCPGHWAGWGSTGWGTTGGGCSVGCSFQGWSPLPSFQWWCAEAAG